SVWLLKAGHDEWEANGEKSEYETQRAMDSLSQLIKISREPGDMKAIFGFPCVKGVIMNPTELDRVFSVVYMTDKIPIPQEGFGELAVFFPGCPLESSILVQGYEMKVGALSFEPGIEDQNVFSVKTKKYKKVSSDELDVIMNNE
ncbi:MAG TPA: hypothetical protein VFV79_06915, partial [Saprospiraceae bacterium]|nr:hypothetical protein [Saprospiraceae bacterium]